MTAGVGKGVTAGVVALCAAPLAALNVWPRVSAMLASGVNGNDIGVTLLVVVAALLMAAVPFAMEKAPNRGFWWFCGLFGAALAMVNYTLAVGAVGKVRDLGAGEARELITRAAGVDAGLERARNSRTQLPQFVWTTAEGVAAARQAVATAKVQAQAECNDRGKPAERCRAREEDERKALAALAAATGHRAVTERAERLDAEIQRLEAERAKLNPPETVDAHAARLAKVVGKLVDLGPNPVEAVADAVISILAIFAELIGLLGPRIILTAIGGGRQPEFSRRRENSIPEKPPVEQSDFADVAKVAAPAASTPAPAGVDETAATPAPSRKARKGKAPPLRELGDVREWHRSRTVARSGAKTKPTDAYRAYSGWCVEQGKVPVSLTAFGTIMKARAEDGGCGVTYEERNKRGFYLDIVVVSGPRLAVSNE